MKRNRFLQVAALVMIFSACALSQAMAAYEYFDDFSTGIDPFWWTIESSSKNMVNYSDTDHCILMSQKPDSAAGGYLSGAAKLKFNFPMQGDFSASITYNLTPVPDLPTWPTPDNYERIGIRTDLGNVARVSDSRLGTQSELYLTDFKWDDKIYLAGTSEMKGRLRIKREGSKLFGAWYVGEDDDGNPLWQSIRQDNEVSTADTADTPIEVAIWPGDGANHGIMVAFDDFNLHVYAADAVDPRGVTPEPASMLLFGIGATAMAVIKRKKKNTV
jgi:hypothetical protein